MPGWETFFTAQVAASATLVGLLFVGVSLNLKMILSNDGLPDRALAGALRHRGDQFHPNSAFSGLAPRSGPRRPFSAKVRNHLTVAAFGV